MSKLGVLADISALPSEGVVVVGFSGGADSTAMAHWLAGKIAPERIILAHVNHMLRGEEAERDEASAREFAREMGLRFVVSRVDVAALARQRGMGLEECGRAVRYEFFEKLAASENDRILTAHNANDNAETLLLNLCRGTGLDGLCGIPYRRGKIVRPLLRVSRGEIEEYCRENELCYVTDSTNLSDEYTRNKIRLQVMPVLQEINSRFVESASQTAQILTRERDFLRDEAEDLLLRAKRAYGLDAKMLAAAPEAVCAGALRLWLERQGCGRLEKKHIDDALNCVKLGRAAQLPSGVTMRRAQGVLSAAREKAAEPFELKIAVPTEFDRAEKTVLCDGKILKLEKKRVNSEKSAQKIHNLLFKNALDCDIITNTLVARTRRDGDRFAPIGSGVTKSMKQVFQACGMPTHLRQSALLLECRGRLAWCEGVGASREFAAGEKSRAVMTVEIINQE